MKLHLTSEAVVQDLFIYYFCIIPWRQPHVFLAVALAFEFFERRIWIGIDNAQSDVVTLSQKGGFWVDFLLRNQYAIPTCCDCVFGCKIPFAHARAVSLLLRVARLTLRVRLLLVFSYPTLATRFAVTSSAGSSAEVMHGKQLGDEPKPDKLQMYFTQLF